MVLDVVKYPDPRLREDTFEVAEITDEIRTLVRDLIDTMFSLNAAGIATLQIDMWEARGVGGAPRPPAAPSLTFPDADPAVAFQAPRPPNDAPRNAVLGFYRGGVQSQATAERH